MTPPFGLLALHTAFMVLIFYGHGPSGTGVLPYEARRRSGKFVFLACLCGFLHRILVSSCIPYPMTVKPTWDDTFASACLCLSGRSSERVKRSGYIAYSFSFTSPVDANLECLVIKLCLYLVYSLGSDRRRTDEGAT
jgi:hypothetical protein